MLFQYLLSNYEENEPIFLNSIKINGLSDVNLRQQIKKLTDEGKLKRFDTGIYFIPKKSMFKSGSQLSKDKVIEKKYIFDMNYRCGYFTGIMFANQMRLTTQIPMVYEVATNKATKDVRETFIANTRVIVRKPRSFVTEDNYKYLQFLDLLKDIDSYSEITGKELQSRINEYMRKADILFPMLEKYLDLYPDKLYRNMYETGVLNYVPA